MSALAAWELTEDRLAAAVAEASVGRGEQLVLVVGSRAKLRADRIVRSPGGPLHEVALVALEPRADPDHWALKVVPKRRRRRRRS